MADARTAGMLQFSINNHDDDHVSTPFFYEKAAGNRSGEGDVRFTGTSQSLRRFPEVQEHVVRGTPPPKSEQSETIVGSTTSTANGQHRELEFKCIHPL